MTASPGRHRQLAGIQYLRVLAALSVVLFHTFGYVLTLGGPNLFPPYFVGAAGVDLFFIISGFVMVYSSSQQFGLSGAPIQFVRSRLTRIVPLYWLFTIAWITFRLVTHHVAVWQPDVIAASLLFWPYTKPDGSVAPIYGIGWTLNNEMFFYALFALGLLFPRRTGLALVVVMLCCIVGVGLILPLPTPFRFWANPIVLEFVLGIGLGLAYLQGVRVPASGAIAIGIAGVISLTVSTAWGFNFASGDRGGELLRVFIWGVPSAAIFVALILRRFEQRPSLQPFAILGDASYAIYLAHPLVIVGLWPILPQMVALLPGHPSLPVWSHIAGMYVLAVAAGVVTHLVVEQPLLRFFRMKRHLAIAVTA